MRVPAYRYGSWSGGRDPLEPPYDVAAAVDEIGESVLAGASDWWLLLGMAVVYVAVIRPLMRPVREASKLRRRLAYQAFRDGKDNEP